MPDEAYMWQPPYWPLRRVVEELPDGTEVAITPCGGCGAPTISNTLWGDRPDARHLGLQRKSRGLRPGCYRDLRTQLCGRCKTRTPREEWDDYESKTWPWRSLVEEWAFLHGGDESDRQIAERLGVRFRHLQDVIRKARRVDPSLLPIEYRVRWPSAQASPRQAHVPGGRRQRVTSRRA